MTSSGTEAAPREPAHGEPLNVDRRGDGVVVVTLSDPRRRNAMTAAMTESWSSVMASLREDRTVRVVVVTGAGSAFCSGGDTGWIASEPGATIDALRDRMMRFYRTWLSIRDLEVPTIAAINGPAVGAGLCLALACDLRYAAESAKLTAPFTRLGMHAGMAATWLLPEVAGLALAREMLLTGRVLTGAEASAEGLVNRCFPDDRLIAEVDGIAEGVAATAPVAARLTTVALRSGGHADFEAALRWEGLAQPVTLATEDLHEGLAATRERRTPRFRGR